MNQRQAGEALPDNKRVELIVGLAAQKLYAVRVLGTDDICGVSGTGSSSKKAVATESH